MDIGCNGRISDGGVFRNSKFFQAFENNALDIPKADFLPGTEQLIPYVLVADEAFPLREDLLKPYSQRGLTPERSLYNYRLSRARRVVENAFGILSNRFLIFLSPINLIPEKAEAITLAAVLCIISSSHAMKHVKYIYHTGMWTQEILKLMSYNLENGIMDTILQV